ncbi:hypothetical protein UZ35_12195, partial [Heyndrickxia coagulans]
FYSSELKTSHVPDFHFPAEITSRFSGSASLLFRSKRLGFPKRTGHDDHPLSSAAIFPHIRYVDNFSVNF